MLVEEPAHGGEARQQVGLAARVPAAWRDALRAELDGEGFRALEAFVAAERARGDVYPPHDRVFAALEHTPPDDVRVVLLGQDPYPTAGNANGLAFSVAPGHKLPASLRNLLLGVQADLGHPLPASGDLGAWARAGVLLLNTVLTVREGEPHSHRKKGWEPLTTAILRHVDRGPAPVVFLALGNHAQAMVGKLVDPTRHHVLALPHPSPLNGNAFVEAARKVRPFTRANALLRAGGRAPIDWSLAPA